MNNPKTIEAIKVLYRGDIDDAPEGTPLVLSQDFRWLWGESENDPFDRELYSQELKTGAMEAVCKGEYQLVRALCLQEPASDEHPLHAGYVLIDGQKRELRRFGNYSALEGFACPHCELREVCFVERDRCKCGSIRYDNMMVDRDHEVWLSPPPAPVKEPELDEFEKWLNDQTSMMRAVPSTRQWVEETLAKYRQIKQQGAQ